MILWGYDIDNRPAIYFRPSRQNLEPGIRQVQFVVWGLERMIELMGPGVEYVHTIPTVFLLVHASISTQNDSADGELR